ncbi:6-phosphogluconolactonase [Planctomycetes bacterium Poly30]|uniref:6-phosphogluconolactonase n=1 Tax=Saltatorellus ferox TaxID=2528018 RepID=A0A518ENX7_9BACT|nr:6-phosphogluconolactonase [Planctomycetes bacterium Poly30]
MQWILLVAVLFLAPSRPAPPASHLFVSCGDGSLHSVALVNGLPGDSVVSLDLGEPLRFLATHPSLPIVYALGSEHLMAVRWNQASATFETLGKALVGISGTHVALDPSARWALVASYGEGAVSCLPISAEGLPQAAVGRMGGSEDKRLTRAHQVCWHPGGELAYVPALGADQVAILSVDPKSGALTWAGAAAVAAGSGPRHMALHPSQPWAFVLGEHSSTITSFTLQEEGKRWSRRGQTSNLSEGFTESGSRSSDIHISADGGFLFAVNREPANDLTAYAIGEDGALREVSRRSTGGIHARTFALDPQGERVWIANTRSKNVVTLTLSKTGELGEAGGSWEAPAEISCVLAR